MAKIKIDGVVEAAHFKADGQLAWVRVYERRGVVFSDCLIVNRDAFVKQLKAGKRYMLGKRKPNLGGMFDVTQPVHLVERDGRQTITAGDGQTSNDELAGVPIL